MSPVPAPKAPSQADLEYAGLLLAASEALTKAREYHERSNPGMWRPAFSDLIMMDSLKDWIPEEREHRLGGTPVEAMATLVANDRVVNIPDGFWEYQDSDLQDELEKVGMLFSMETCAHCGGTDRVSECEDCEVATCAACWESVGCVECGSTE